MYIRINCDCGGNFFNGPHRQEPPFALIKAVCPSCSSVHYPVILCTSNELTVSIMKSELSDSLKLALKEKEQRFQEARRIDEMAKAVDAKVKQRVAESLSIKERQNQDATVNSASWAGERNWEGRKRTRFEDRYIDQGRRVYRTAAAGFRKVNADYYGREMAEI